MEIEAWTTPCDESPRAAGDHIPIISLFPSGDRYWKTRVSGTACSDGGCGAAVAGASVAPLAGVCRTGVAPGGRS
jgi:hypothetical protein